MIELAKPTLETFTELWPLLRELHASVGIAPLNPEKCRREFISFMQEGITLLARSESGEVVGFVCLVKGELYFSDETYLQDKGIYVKPEHRGTVGLQLLLAVRAEAVKRNTFVLVWDTNPSSRRNRGGVIDGIKNGEILQRLGFFSAGYLLRIQGSTRNASRSCVA